VGEGKNDDTIGIRLGTDLGDMERELCLSHPTGPDQGHEPSMLIAQECYQELKIRIPANEGAYCRRNGLRSLRLPIDRALCHGGFSGNETA